MIGYLLAVVLGTATSVSCYKVLSPIVREVISRELAGE